MAHLATGLTLPPIAHTPPETKVEPQKMVPENGDVKTIWERFIDQIEVIAESSRFQGTMALIGVTAIGLALLFVLASNPVGWLASAFTLSYVAAKVIFIVGVYVAEALFLVGPFYVFDNQSTYKVETGNTRYVIAKEPPPQISPPDPVHSSDPKAPERITVPESILKVIEMPENEFDESEREERLKTPTGSPRMGHRPPQSGRLKNHKPHKFSSRARPSKNNKAGQLS